MNSRSKAQWIVWLTNEKAAGRALESYIAKGQLVLDKEEAESHLRKAFHNLEFAKVIEDLHSDKTKFHYAGETFYDWEIIVSYYAIYHACLALVASKGYSSKSHAATLCALIKFFYHAAKQLSAHDIHTAAQVKSLEEEYIREFARMKSDREDAAYNISIEFQRELAEMNRKKAIDFVNRIKAILEVKNG